ncbi:hypothetical protein [Phenylobacterium sp.]|jgi:hypothetical protein|uniref:DUF6035 family protein n=1 Tax=Phenylobacterium sp. TaxID=1871053 RepID=UPI002730B82D|nr:hypothetical protein [Phenylobacterium sp.]MDP1873425.1 hypothetical protein [Phenylobacterium sp.]
MRGNITIDPLARATAVADPQIREVRSLKSGQILEARRLIESVRYDRLVQVRSQIKEAMDAGSPRVACAICGTAVYIVSSPDKAFFFRYRIEDGSCPAQTRDGLSEDDIRIMKYKGAQESEAHRLLKALIERSLLADPRFQDVLAEKVWRGQRDPTSLRRPDIQAGLDGLRIAFEAQLTTTFLDVVIGRKTFYRAEGGLLVWVLPHFDPAYRQLTIDDLLFNNNANVLVVDRESAEASEAAGRLMLRCAFRRPVVEAGGLGSVWESELVAWDDLTIDLQGQRVFAFDSEGEERRLIAERNQALAAAREAADQRLRDSLLAIATGRAADGDWKARSAAWQALKAQYEARDLMLPGEYEIDQRFRNIACGVASALAGRPVGYGFDKLIQVAHHLADNFPEALVPFGHALRSAGHQGVLKDQDRQGRWTRKAAGHRDAVRTGDPAYDISEEMRALLRFVFPSLSAALT